MLKTTKQHALNNFPKNLHIHDEDFIAVLLVLSTVTETLTTSASRFAIDSLHCWYLFTRLTPTIML